MNRSADGGMALCLLAAGMCPALAQRTAPQFQDYRIVETYNGRNAPLVLSRRDTTFRSRLRLAASQRPNFAGHYIVTAWGCGADCLIGAVIDANSGIVSWLPFTLCCWASNVDRPIQYRLDSRLIVFTGERNEQAGDDGNHYYEFRAGKFVEISPTQ